MQKLGYCSGIAALGRLGHFIEPVYRYKVPNNKVSNHKVSNNKFPGHRLPN
jgi:hypothetical protein